KYLSQKSILKNILLLLLKEKELIEFFSLYTP
ncbi:unnamed protein product, partial [marine sediment metagenome]